MTSSQPATDTTTGDDARAARDHALTALFRKGELVWRVDEKYDAKGDVWAVMLVRQGPQGGWKNQRYRYDVPTDGVYFVGERPLSDTEVAEVRRKGILIHPPERVQRVA